MAETSIDMLPPARPENVRYRRDSAFSYTCHACSRCCYDKVIQLNPYEGARLAENRGVSTTEFLAGYTEANGTALRRVEGGACVFLTPQGCGVHPDRPLVCRLYPLGRRVTAEGVESFHESKPHPETEGEYGSNGTVQDFLTRQGAQPFIDVVDRYVELVGRMSAVLSATLVSDAQLKRDVQEVAQGFAQGQEESIPEWIDMGRSVAQFCARHGLSVPSDVPSQMKLHIQAIEEWVRSMQSFTKEGTNEPG